MFSSTPIGIALRIALIYIIIGGLWILGSDQLMAFIFSSSDTLVRISMYKGWFYIAVTGCLLFFLVLGSTGRSIKAESTARDSEDKFRTLFEDMATGCCLDEIIYNNTGCAVDYRILDVNPTFERLIGISKSQAVGKLASALYGGGTAPNMGIYNTVDKTGEPVTFESFFAPTEKHLLITASRISKGRFCTIFSDITERRRLEAQLQQAQKMESVGRLAGGVAHDYNNMLGVILGHAELAINRVDSDKKLHSQLETIIDAAQRSSEITKQLLAFARKQTISPKIMNICETIESMIKILERLIGENIELLWEPKQELWLIKMDPAQIDQILANLCVNAKDAIAGTGKITIKTDNVILDEAFCANNIGSTPGEYVLLEVSDNGCGMNQETIDKIFEPFFTTKEESKGTGLGLSTVYGIVKQNKGLISVHSELEQGTTFSIYIPRNDVKITEIEFGAADEIVFSRGETVLLVEDEKINMEMVKSILKELGYNVLATKVPSDAIEIGNIHKGDIDLLITDVVMPDMNGNELSAQLCNTIPSIKTLFMSGYPSDIIAHHGILNDGVNFIQKPFSIKELSIKIRTILDA